MNPSTAIQSGSVASRKTAPSAVVSFAAPIEAGKTTVSTGVASRLSAPRVSFGGYLRRLALERGMEVTRENLQDLGDELVKSDVRGFCERVLQQEDWQPDRPLIIDGVRHIEVLDVLKDMLEPAEEFLIYIKIDPATQAKRLEHDDLSHTKPLEELERHPTEVQVRTKLPDRAALVLDGTQSAEALTEKVVEFLRQGAGARSGGGWQQKNARRIELAEKKSRGELQGAELAEFDQLQTEYFDYLDAKYPRTPADLERLAEIEARLKAAEGK